MSHTKPDELQSVLKTFLGNRLVTTNGRTRSLIVKGSEQDVRRAAELVAMVDTPPGKQRPKVKNYAVFQLQHAPPQELFEIINHFLPNQVVALPEAKLLIAGGSDDALREVELVVREIDVPSRCNSAGPTPLGGGIRK